jgi:hypothetical protein
VILVVTAVMIQTFLVMVVTAEGTVRTTFLAVLVMVILVMVIAVAT